MKKTGILAVALCLGLGALAQSNGSTGSATKKEVKAEGFTGIEATSAIEVIVTMGVTEGVVFEAGEDALAKLKAEVKKGELHLYVDGNLNNEGPLKAYVSAKTLNELGVSGAASINVKQAITCDKMELKATGAGSIKLEINAKEVTANTSGAAQIKLSGTTKKLIATATGAACLKAEDLKANDVEVTATGAGNAKVNVSESLNAHASGAGNVTYIGEPKRSQVNAKSAGSINKKS
jgi:hypothetical protein